MAHKIQPEIICNTNYSDQLKLEKFAKELDSDFEAKVRRVEEILGAKLRSISDEACIRYLTLPMTLPTKESCDEYVKWQKTLVLDPPGMFLANLDYKPGENLLDSLNKIDAILAEEEGD